MTDGEQQEVQLPAFRIGKVFKDNAKAVNSMDYSDDGELLVTASDDESLRLYNCREGSSVRMLYSKKYGVDQVRFTHHNNAVICASKNGWDQTVRYLSLHDNRYLRYFKGHRDRVVSLTMSPMDDHFLSGSLDGTVRLWDLRANGCQGLMRLAEEGTSQTGQAVACAYDPEGLVFGVAVGDNHVRLYDVRTYDQGPFATFSVQPKTAGSGLTWTGMEFSNDGGHIVLSSTAGIFAIDAFDGHLVQEYGTEAPAAYPSVATVSPDCSFVLAGRQDGSVSAWSLLGGQELPLAADKHPGAVTLVKWNPKYQMVASACSALSFWLPGGSASATA